MQSSVWLQLAYALGELDDGLPSNGKEYMLLDLRNCNQNCYCTLCINTYLVFRISKISFIMVDEQSLYIYIFEVCIYIIVFFIITDEITTEILRVKIELAYSFRLFVRFVKFLESWDNTHNGEARDVIWFANYIFSPFKTKPYLTLGKHICDVQKTRFEFP